MNVELHIGELVLHDFPQGPSERYRIGAAVERELARLIAEQGVPLALTSLGEVDGLDGGEFHVAPGSSAELIGAQIAQSVYRGFGR
ncbi:MAG TPA: hypothetical protein VJG32_09720 [Anaerolineae bacterium]|nr:hypothetical protein [Anaerolineae bacterium]